MCQTYAKHNCGAVPLLSSCQRLCMEIDSYAEICESACHIGLLQADTVSSANARVPSSVQAYM